MPVRYGYARVSSGNQSLDIQLADLNAHAVEHIRSEKVSAKSTENRPQLALLLEFMRPGDELWVTRLDRLARSTLDLCDIVRQLERKQCSLHATQQAIETKSSTGRLLVQILGVVSEFELEIRKERQLAGIAQAKERGVYARPRSPKFPPEEIHRLHQNGMAPMDIARKLKCTGTTIYRVLGARRPPADAAQAGDTA